MHIDYIAERTRASVRTLVCTSCSCLFRLNRLKLSSFFMKTSAGNFGRIFLSSTLVTSQLSCPCCLPSQALRALLLNLCYLPFLPGSFAQGCVVVVVRVCMGSAESVSSCGL